MELIVLWWMIEEDEEDDGDAVEDDGEVVVPSPFLCQILYEAPGYHRAKHRNRHRGEEDKAIGRTTHFVGNQLAQNSGKGQLPRCAEPDEDVCAYEVIYAICCSCHDRADQGQASCGDEEISPPEDIRHAANERVPDGQ